MARNMPGNAAETAIKGLDALLKEIDPEVLLAGSLGAIAASRGIIPPFTRLLMAMNSSLQAEDIKEKALKVSISPWAGIGTVWAGIAAFATGRDEEGQPVDPDKYALAASGAMEAMMMMSLVKNPGFLELIGKGIEKIPTATL